MNITVLLNAALCGSGSSGRQGSLIVIPTSLAKGTIGSLATDSSYSVIMDRAAAASLH